MYRHPSHRPLVLPSQNSHFDTAHKSWASPPPQSVLSPIRPPLPSPSPYLHPEHGFPPLEWLHSVSCIGTLSRRPCIEYPAARSSLIAFLEEAIQIGHLTIKDKEKTYCFGCRGAESSTVELRVTNDDFWTRVLLYVPVKLYCAFNPVSSVANIPSKVC